KVATKTEKSCCKEQTKVATKAAKDCCQEEAKKVATKTEKSCCEEQTKVATKAAKDCCSGDLASRIAAIARKAKDCKKAAAKLAFVKKTCGEITGKDVAAHVRALDEAVAAGCPMGAGTLDALEKGLECKECTAKKAEKKAAKKTTKSDG
ncbi:MAG: hypothetical protein CMJ83_09890, partial [Planctomycetes bacterium]|nr:hypothetical protein [Planctomycetota bacterium]